MMSIPDLLANVFMRDTHTQFLVSCDFVQLPIDLSVACIHTSC